MEGEYLIVNNDNHPNLKQSSINNITMIERILDAGVKNYPRILQWFGGSYFEDNKIAYELVKHAEQIYELDLQNEAIRAVYLMILEKNQKQ